MQQPDRSLAILNSILENPHAGVGVMITLAQAYASLNDLPKLEATLERLVKLAPSQPEAWYNLAATKALAGKESEVFRNLRQALDLNAKRLALNSNAPDLRRELENDPKFNALRTKPEFNALLAPK